MKAFLSPPCMNGDVEQRLVAEAFASNYIAPCGPMVERLEADAARVFGFKGVLATISGTMALELLARDLQIAPGDVVIASDLTFIASVAPFVTLGAKVVFVDASPESWCMDPALLEEALNAYPQTKAVIATDLYGQSCDVDALRALCDRTGAKLIVDAAESVGATCRGQPAGKGAWAAVYSLNGNKIITSGGGGMLLSDDVELIARSRKRAAQAREDALWYEHQEVGTQGRLGNVPAAIAVGQLQHLADALADKERVWNEWSARFASRDWIQPMPTAAYGTPNRWLTVCTLTGKDSFEAIRRLQAAGFEARPVWKPMHLQPVFASNPAFLSGAGEDFFNRGICLPSGRKLTGELMDEMMDILEAL